MPKDPRARPRSATRQTPPDTTPPEGPKVEPDPEREALLEQIAKLKQENRRLEAELKQLRKKNLDQQKRLKKAGDEKNRLLSKVQKLEKERKQALRELTQAQQQAASFRNGLAETEAKLQSATGKISQLLAAKERLEREKLSVESERTKATKELAEVKRELSRLRAEKESWEPLIKAKALAEMVRPYPLPLEALFRVLVLDYFALGTNPSERVEVLLEIYEALLHEQTHPRLKEVSNALALEGEPEGIVLLGTEHLLEDLANLPIRKWLRLRGFKIESWLLQQNPLRSPRLAEGEAE